MTEFTKHYAVFYNLHIQCMYRFTYHIFRLIIRHLNGVNSVGTNCKFSYLDILQKSACQQHFLHATNASIASAR